MSLYYLEITILRTTCQFFLSAFSYFSVNIFLGAVGFLKRKGVDRRGCPRAPCVAEHGRCDGVCASAWEFCSSPLQPFKSLVVGWFLAVLLWLWALSRCQPALPGCGTPVAPAGASVQGSAGARRKPLLKTSAVTLIVGLPFLILSVRQQSAWRFVLSCLNLVNIVSKKLTEVTIL